MIWEFTQWFFIGGFAFLVLWMVVEMIFDLILVIWGSLS